jgi:hypothetical protein
MIERVIPHLQKFWMPILAISFLMGLAFIVVGLFKMAEAGNRFSHQRTPFSGSSLMVLIGIVLMNIPGVLDTLTLTTLQQPSMQELSYMPPEGVGRSYIRLAIYIVQLVGLCAVVRGCALLRMTARNGGGFGRAVTHTIGGAWAVNIIGFFRMVGLTVGGPIQNAVQFTLG